MAKRATTLPLTLPQRPAGAPAARWLTESIRAEILGGRLAPGARLPATRDLAQQYGLSRGTVVHVFEQLRSEGYVVGVTGAGTRVSDVLPEQLLQLPKEVRPTAVAEGSLQRAPARALSGFADRVTFFRGYEPRSLRAFRANQPALDLFPTTLWAQVAARRLRRASTALLLGTEPLGYPPLREAVVDYLRISRGVRCEVGQVVIVSGAQEALDLVARLTLDAGDRVAIEDPGYRGAARVFEACGATLVPVPVDADGMTVGGERWRGVRLAYCTPAHQFPLGMSMSLPRRLMLLDWARASGGWVFEDDYDAEYRYAGHPVPALQGLDRHGVVCFSGTFSKVLFPSLRLGYLIVPPALVDAVAAAKSVVTRHAPLLDQAILADFIADGHFARHLRRMRQTYAERLQLLLEDGAAVLSGLVDFSPVEAGLQTVGWLCAGRKGTAVERVAAARGVEVTALARFAREPMGREGIQLGFAAVDAPEIRRGVRELEVAMRGMRGDSHR
jgi:GntR family transcriptional regulator/MocR family aminotransferase